VKYKVMVEGKEVGNIEYTLQEKIGGVPISVLDDRAGKVLSDAGLASADCILVLWPDKPKSDPRITHTQDDRQAKPL